jgi:ABC-type phosphate transport system substrate-binding protein
MNMRLILLLALFATPATAREQIAVVISAKSTVTSLSDAQVKDLFLGNAEFLPNGEKALPVDQPRTAEITQGFYSLVAGMSIKELSVHWAKMVFTGHGTPPPQVDGGDAKIKDWVNSKPNGIGYISGSAVDGSVKVLYRADLQ